MTRRLRKLPYQYALICKVDIPKQMTFAEQMRYRECSLANASIPSGYVNAMGYVAPMPFDPETVQLYVRILP